MARRPIVTSKPENQKQSESHLMYVATEEPEARPNPTLRKPIPILLAAVIVAGVEFVFASSVVRSETVPIGNYPETLIAVGAFGLIVAMAIGAGGTRDPRSLGRHGWMLPARPEDTHWVYRFMTENMRESTRHFSILGLGSVIVICIGVGLHQL